MACQLCFFLKNFKHSKVISFEPNTVNNFFLNKVKKKFLNFNFHNLALGSSKKNLHFIFQLLIL